MGSGVRVDVDAAELAAGARRLDSAATTLEALAGRVLSLCAGARGCVGGIELAGALEAAGQETARAVGQGASAVEVLGSRTGAAAHDYRLLELALTDRWVAR